MGCDRLGHTVRHKIGSDVFPVRGGQLGDAGRHATADGNLFKNRLVSEAEFEAFHGFLTMLRTDMANSPGKTTKSAGIRGNSARKAVNSVKELVKSHKNLINSLSDLTKS